MKKTTKFEAGQNVIATIRGQRRTGHLTTGQRNKINGKYFYQDDRYGWAWLKVSEIEIVRQ